MKTISKVKQQIAHYYIDKSKDEVHWFPFFFFSSWLPRERQYSSKIKSLTLQHKATGPKQ